MVVSSRSVSFPLSYGSYIGCSNSKGLVRGLQRRACVWGGEGQGLSEEASRSGMKTSFSLPADGFNAAERGRGDIISIIVCMFADTHVQTCTRMHILN